MSGTLKRIKKSRRKSVHIPSGPDVDQEILNMVDESVSLDEVLALRKTLEDLTETTAMLEQENARLFESKNPKKDSTHDCLRNLDTLLTNLYTVACTGKLGDSVRALSSANEELRTQRDSVDAENTVLEQRIKTLTDTLDQEKLLHEHTRKELEEQKTLVARLRSEQYISTTQITTLKIELAHERRTKELMTDAETYINELASKHSHNLAVVLNQVSGIVSQAEALQQHSSSSRRSRASPLRRTTQISQVLDTARRRTSSPTPSADHSPRGDVVDMHNVSL